MRLMGPSRAAKRTLCGTAGATAAPTGVVAGAVTGRGLRRRPFLFLAPVATLAWVAATIVPAMAEDATAWLERSATAARSLNYVGTIVYQHGSRVETSRLVHMNDGTSEFE